MVFYQTGRGVSENKKSIFGVKNSKIGNSKADIEHYYHHPFLKIEKVHQTKEEIRQDGNSSLADNLVELSATFNLSERSTTLLSPPPLYYTASATPLETH